MLDIFDIAAVAADLLTQIWYACVTCKQAGAVNYDSQNLRFAEF